MKKMKKTLALLLVLAMAVTTWGCGKKDDEASTKPTDDATVETPATTEDTDTASTDKFYIYSWNTEFETMINDYFLKDNPQYKDRIVYVNTGGSETYQEKIDAVLNTPDAEEAPDLMLLEADYIKKYVSSDYTLPISDLGITDADYADQYAYTLKIPEDERDGSIKALSWQAAPGVMIYRRSLAEKYLGTQEPDKVQEYVKDMDAFLETARKINKDSNGATKMLSGNDDMFRVYMAARTQPWVTDDVLSIDDKMLEYMDFNKTLEEENLTNKTSQWTEQWNSNVQSDNTFAYMGSTWFVQWTLMQNSGEKGAAGSTYGDWAMCKGPQTYYWGGTWIAATQGCSDKGLAAEIIKYFTCNKDAMYNYSVNAKDYVNNKSAIQQIIDDGKGKFDFLGDQEYYSVFADSAEAIDVSTMTAYDQNINAAFATQVTEYSNGNKDKDTAIADFKAAVVDLYSFISAE